MFTILFPAFIILMGNSIVNTHTHLLASGVVVSHAHPYKKLPDNKQHSHNDNEFFFIHQITNVLLVFSLVVLTVILPAQKMSAITQLKIGNDNKVICNSYANRAPPIC